MGRKDSSRTVQLKPSKERRGQTPRNRDTASHDRLPMTEAAPGDDSNCYCRRPLIIKPCVWVYAPTYLSGHSELGNERWFASKSSNEAGTKLHRIHFHVCHPVALGIKPKLPVTAANSIPPLATKLHTTVLKRKKCFRRIRCKQQLTLPQAGINGVGSRRAYKAGNSSPLIKSNLMQYLMRF